MMYVSNSEFDITWVIFRHYPREAEHQRMMVHVQESYLRSLFSQHEENLKVEYWRTRVSKVLVELEHEYGPIGRIIT